MTSLRNWSRYILVLFFVYISFPSEASQQNPTFEAHRIKDQHQSRLAIKNQVLSLLPHSKKDILKLTLVGELKAPRIEHKTVQASDIQLTSNFAFVGYNYAGDLSLGGVDLLDVSSPSRPRLLEEVLSKNSEINAMSFDQSNRVLYLVGDSSALKGNPAFLAKYRIEDETAEVFLLPSFTGTGVFVGKHSIYATSGDNGGLSLFNKATMSPTAFVPLKDARAVDSFSAHSDVFVLSGGNGQLHDVSKDGELLNSVPMPGNSLPDSKSTLEVGRAMSLVSLGERGAAVVCNRSGKVVASIPAVSVAGIPPEDTVTNSATECGGIIFTANGGAGVYAYGITAKGFRQQKDCSDLTVITLGQLSFGEERVSANQVRCQGENLFVASGLGGTKVINVAIE